MAGSTKKHELSVLKLQNHPLVKDGKTLAEVKKMLDLCSRKLEHIEKLHVEIELKGRGFHSVEQLERAKKFCEDIWLLDKSIQGYIGSLQKNAALPVIPDEKGL